MQLFNVFLDHLPQVHKRATECINAHNILQKIHSGDCPENLLTDNSILQQLKVFLVCLFVCLFYCLYVCCISGYTNIIFNKQVQYFVCLMWFAISKMCSDPNFLTSGRVFASLCHLYTCVPPDWEDPTPLALRLLREGFFEWFSRWLSKN